MGNIDDKNLENVTGAGGDAHLQKDSGNDDNDLVINPVEPPGGGGGADQPDTEGGGGGNQDLQI